MSGGGAFGLPPGSGLFGSGAGLETLAGVHRGFVEALRAAAGVGGAHGRPFEEFAARFFGAVPGVAGAPPTPPGAPGGLGGAAVPPLPGGPALGPTREHQRRYERLPAALAAWSAAQQAQAALLASVGARAGAEFLAHLATRDLANDGLRATFDAWIEHAEGAWQKLAHSAEWCAAQARTFDAMLAVRAAQQAIADDAARLAGLPTLRDVDALHRRVREVERGRAPPDARAAPPTARRKPAPGKAAPTLAESTKPASTKRTASKPTSSKPTSSKPTSSKPLTKRAGAKRAATRRAPRK